MWVRRRNHRLGYRQPNALRGMLRPLEFLCQPHMQRAAVANRVRNGAFNAAPQPNPIDGGRFGGMANPLNSSAPTPQSGAAALSAEGARLTPAQVQAYRSAAKGRKLLEPQPAGVADPNIYVPGVAPNAAEIEQSVDTARELKSLNVTAPDVSEEAKEIAATNNKAGQQYFADIAGSDVSVVNAKAARESDSLHRSNTSTGPRVSRTCQKKSAAFDCGENAIGPFADRSATVISKPRRVIGREVFACHVRGKCSDPKLRCRIKAIDFHGGFIPPVRVISK